MAAIGVETETAAVAAVLDRYVASVEQEDLGLFAQVMAHDDDMVNFGSDAAERIVGWEALQEAIAAQNVALSEIRIDQHDVTIHLARDGTCAWATSLCEFRARAEQQRVELPLRCSWVLERREPGWVIVHFHSSVGQAG